MSSVDELVRTVSVRRLTTTHLTLGARWGKRWSSTEPGARVYAQLDGSAALDVHGERVTLAPGDFAFLPRADAHVIRDQASTTVRGSGACPGMRQTDAETFEYESSRDGRMVIADLVHETDASWLSLLPPVVRISASTHETARWIRETLDLLQVARSLPPAARDAVATTLGHVLFTHALELAAPDGEILRDASVAEVLAQVRTSPDQPWELDVLARNAGLSRTVFLERATALLGMPIGRYVRELRMGWASRLLMGTDAGVKEIAKRVGYANESAFARAFTRAAGTSPARFRARAKGGVATMPAGDTARLAQDPAP